MEIFELKVAGRPVTGSKQAVTERKNGLIPCVLYSKDEVVHFTTILQDIKHLIFTPEFRKARIDVNGQIHECIVKEIQKHPVTDQIIHMDFLKLVPGHPVKADVPVRVKGAAPGVKQGGKLVTRLRRVRIKATPEALVGELFIDISALEMGQVMRVRDMEIPAGVEVITNSSIPVVQVDIPRAFRQEQATTAKK